MTWRNKVSSSKLPMILMGRLIVCLRGFYGRMEIPKINQFTINSNTCPIRFLSSDILRAYGNSSESGGASQLCSLIAIVLLARNFPKIMFSTIKAVSIYMVNFFSRETKNEGMKGDYFPPMFTTSGNIGSSVKVPGSSFLKSPLKAANYVRVLVVDHCRLALGEWDNNHFIIISDFGGAKCNQ